MNGNRRRCECLPNDVPRRATPTTSLELLDLVAFDKRGIDIQMMRKKQDAPCLSKPCTPCSGTLRHVSVGHVVQSKQTHGNAVRSESLGDSRACPRLPTPPQAIGAASNPQELPAGQIWRRHWLHLPVQRLIKVEPSMIPFFIAASSLP
jgi:hypothetical protein